MNILVSFPVISVAGQTKLADLPNSAENRLGQQHDPNLLFAFLARATVGTSLYVLVRQSIR